jgi:hypothetical protein
VKPQGHVPASAPIGAHEGADLDVPLITRLAVLLGSILVLLVLGTLLTFHLYEKQYPHRTSEAAPVVTSAELPPAPRLQTEPRADLQAVRLAEDAHLKGYAWVDRANGVARIPIERAMARWVELQNTAATAQPAKTVGAPPDSRGDASSGVTELQMRQDKAKGGAHGN